MQDSSKAAPGDLKLKAALLTKQAVFPGKSMSSLRTLGTHKALLGKKEFTNHGDSKAQDKCRAISKWIEEIHNGKN